MPKVRYEFDVDGTDITGKIKAEIEFQVWCARCGNGICGNTQYKRGSENEFTTYCEKCEEEFNDLEKEKAQLEQEVVDLQYEIKTLWKRIENGEG